MADELGTIIVVRLDDVKFGETPSPRHKAAIGSLTVTVHGTAIDALHALKRKLRDLAELCADKAFQIHSQELKARK